MLLPTPNTITTDMTDFYVSYNTTDTAIYGDVTTALVWGQMQGFYILVGDHRRAYKDLAPLGWPACFTYYRSQRAAHHRYSDPVFPPSLALLGLS